MPVHQRQKEKGTHCMQQHSTSPAEEHVATWRHLFSISVVAIRRIGGDISYAHVCFYDYGSAQETERSVRDRLLRGWRSDQPGYEIYDVIVRELSLAEIRKECPECW